MLATVLGPFAVRHPFVSFVIAAALGLLYRGLKAAIGRAQRRTFAAEPAVPPPLAPSELVSLAHMALDQAEQLRRLAARLEEQAGQLGV